MSIQSFYRNFTSLFQIKITLTHSTAHAHAHAHAHVRTHTHARAHARTLVTFQLSKPTTRCGYVFIFFFLLLLFQFDVKIVASPRGALIRAVSQDVYWYPHALPTRVFGIEILVEQLFLFSFKNNNLTLTYIFL